MTSKNHILVMLPVTQKHRQLFQEASPESIFDFTKPKTIQKEQVDVANIIIGNVADTPENSKSPTNCPINILSTTVYSAAIIPATIAGIENSNNNFVILSFPSRLCFHNSPLQKF